MFNRLSVNKMGAVFVILIAVAIKWTLVAIVTAINDNPLDALPFANLIFLMFQRPMFVIAFAFGFTPVLLRNSFTYPITAFLEHAFWYPLARLSYGAYLSHGIFMLYRTYNMERGMWACELDSFFLFMAYLSFAFLFSFVITVVIEMPCHRLFQTFILGKQEMPNVAYLNYRGAHKAGDKDGGDSLETTIDSTMTNEFSNSENHENDIMGQTAQTVTFSARESKLKIKEVSPSKGKVPQKTKS